ncbi:recombinase [Rhodococcus kroppenstedtii]|nr:recombinase [Rhodococcus kroppenstedtii]
MIDTAHHRHLLPPPGCAETVRAALDGARTSRLQEVAAVIGGIIARLPEYGWPSALFARRDALILTLATTGLPYTQIAALRACDVTADAGLDALRVETGRGVHTLTSLALAGTGISPRMVYQRWCEVLGHRTRYPSTRMLADALDAVDGDAGLGGYDRYFEPAGKQSLSTPIDRWGHTPLAATPLTARAVAGIVRMHLDGRAPTHLQPIARSQHPEQIPAPDPVPRVLLDPGYYERGTLARRHAHGLLDDVDSVLADVETRADSLLEALVDFLESETARVPADTVE